MVELYRYQARTSLPQEVDRCPNTMHAKWALMQNVFAIPIVTFQREVRSMQVNCEMNGKMRLPEEVTRLNSDVMHRLNTARTLVTTKAD
jgi:hypothetical protein